VRLLVVCRALVGTGAMGEASRLDSFNPFPFSLPVMTKAFTTWALIALTGVSTLFSISSCSKKDDSTPNPSTPAAEPGRIYGSISPTGSIATVTATSSGGQVYTATPTLDQFSSYSFPSLPVGTYTVAYTPTAVFNTPASVPAAITSKNLVTIPQTVATGIVPSATFSGTIGWTTSSVSPLTNISCSAYGSITNTQNFSVFGISNSFRDGSGLNERTETVSLATSDFRGVGTYPITATGSNRASVLINNIGGGSSGTVIGQTGSFTIASFTPATRTITGTFSFDSGTPSISVRTTNGAFSIRY
jgi:hypothetical protein